MNVLELLHTDEGLVAIVCSADGEMHTYSMTLEEFERLKAALEEDL